MLVGVIKQNNFFDVIQFPIFLRRKKFKCCFCGAEVELSFLTIGRRCPHCGGLLIQKNEECI